MGSPELGRQWPKASLQEGLQTPPSWRHVYPGASALGVLREEEEVDRKKLIWRGLALQLSNIAPSLAACIDFRVCCQNVINSIMSFCLTS